MEKKKLLLHVCCAPCLLGCLDKVVDNYDVTLYFYNPNIQPIEEYQKRLAVLKNEVMPLYKGIKLIVEDCKDNYFDNLIKGLEKEKEGGTRCFECIGDRLTKTAEKCAKLSFDCFDSTLSVSPHKNYNYIVECQDKLSKEYNVEGLKINFKKNDGFLKSTKISKELGIYRQNYCGCSYSIWDK